ncbi:unnamed protein product, partial [Scytosiphon promiscuus]
CCLPALVRALAVAMACRQTYRHLPASKACSHGRRLASRQRLTEPVSLPTRTLVSCSLAVPTQSRLRAPAHRAPAPAPPAAAAAAAAAASWAASRYPLSTSTGAAAAGTGEDNVGGDDVKGSKGADRGSEAKSGGGGTVKAEAAAVEEEVPLDVRGLPRPKQRVEVELGTFHEFTAVNKSGGKIFEASRKLIPAKDAIAFPAIEASNLAEGPAEGSGAGAGVAMTEVDFLSRVLAGRVTMVGLFHRQFGYSMLPSWTEPFEEAFAAEQGQRQRQRHAPSLPSAVSLSLLESWPLRMLKPLLVSTMGRGLSQEKRASFFYRFGPTEEVRKALGIVNRLTLYVLLVDQKGRVRWQATGKGTTDEIESLVRCARQLVAEGTGDGGSEGAGAGATARGTNKRGGGKRGSSKW